MKYESQKVAYPYFVMATLLFGLQVVFGLLLGVKYVWPDPLIDILPFNTVRAIHTNLLVVWLLMGFMGGAYYIVPEESQTEIWSTKLAKFQFWLLSLTGVAAVAGFIFGKYGPWWNEGRPLLEAPRWADYLIVVAALTFLFNIFMTMMKTKRWTATQGVLLGGLVMLSVMYLFGMYFFKNLTLDYYYWWWVVHLWVEGAWELIAGSIMAFLMMKMTGVDREVVEKYLYIEVGLVLFTGIIGTGHHYYWIGTPNYWLWWGGIFSALEPLPILFMVIDSVRMAKKRKVEITNKVAYYWALGSVVLHFVGAGVWGLAHTLPYVNRWTHGTQITVSHGHLAFFGAYVMLNLTMFYYALPAFRGVTYFEDKKSIWAFWFMTVAMSFMTLSFGAAGLIQTYFQRILGMDYLVAQTFMRRWMWLTVIFGCFFVGGVFFYIYDFFTAGKQKAAAGAAEAVKA
jgi:nitric oxide reductase subunit B